MDRGLTKRLQELAVELSRGTRPGFVAGGTKDRADHIRRELLEMFNTEQDVSEFKRKVRREVPGPGESVETCKHPVTGKETYFALVETDEVLFDRRATAKGNVIRAILEHLVSAVWGRSSFSSDEHEAAIVKAAKAIPELCDNLQKLESKPVSEGFTKQDLCTFTGYGDGLVNQRLKAIGIKTANGGRPRKGVKPFSKSQVEKLLHAIIDDKGAQEFNKNKCSESLKALQ